MLKTKSPESFSETHQRHLDRQELSLKLAELFHLACQYYPDAVTFLMKLPELSDESRQCIVDSAKKIETEADRLNRKRKLRLVIFVAEACPVFAQIVASELTKLRTEFMVE